MDLNPSKLCDMRTGLLVRIYVSDKIQLESKGVVYEILSKCDDHKGIIVLLDNGDSGHVVEIFPSSSVEIMIERIMDTESHVSENKLNFYEPVMMNKVIPLTVQSFLNSDGGYLYIGIFDPGVTVNEKIVGLKEDRDMVREKLIKLKKIEPEQELSDTEFKDKLVSDMEQILGKFIVSDTPLGPLLDFKFPTINGVMILELNIKRSSMPFFYKHKDKKSKEIEFDILNNGEKITSRKLDEFYYRDGSHKERIETFEHFHRFIKNRFQ